MAVYSDVVEMLQLSGNGRCTTAAVFEKYGYTIPQIVSSETQYRWRKGARLYAVGIDDVIRITGDGKLFRVSAANMTRSDVGISREEVMRRPKIVLPLVDEITVMKNGAELINLVNNGMADIEELSEYTGMKSTRIMQIINVLNMRADKKILVMDASKTRKYTVRLSGDALSFLDTWNELLHLVSIGDHDAAKRLYQLCGISQKNLQ